MKPKIVFLLNSIGIDKGGLTHASLRQASTFAEEGYDTQMLTFTYKQHFNEICDHLVKTGKVSKKVRIRNMFEEYAKYDSSDKPSPQVVHIDEAAEGTYSISKRKGYNAYRYYNNGIYEKYVSLSDENVLDFIDYFNTSRYRVKREYYNIYGEIDRVQYFSYQENAVRQEVFYDKSKKAFLTLWYNPENGNKTRVIHFDENHHIISETTGNEIPHKLHWLNSVINGEDTVAVSDTRSTDELLVHLKNKHVKTILRPHSNHLKNADDPNSELNLRNRYAVENISNVDALVVLTEKQRQDIIQRFGHADKIYVIPNYYEVHLPRVTGIRSLVRNVKHLRELNKDRDMHKVVIISRFSKIKNIHHTIQAFRNVVKAVPDASLEIWGQGDEESHYKQLIKDYRLKDNVKIKGYTEYPEKIYHSAALSVVTSKAEGFSLSVMESMVNNTPVVSYDLRYGPSDMIENGVNGFLIEKNDIETLSEKIIYMLQHPDETQQMGEAAGETMNTKFNKETYQDAWFSLVQELLKDKG